jgi:hypothetical protein
VKSIFAAFLALIAFSAPSVAEVIPGSERGVVGGQLAAHTMPKGEFSHCEINVKYASGIAMHFSMFTGKIWRIGWSHPDWRFPSGERVNIFLFFDGIGPQNFRAVANTKTFATADLTSTAGIFDLMRKANQMTVVADGSRHKFGLEDASAILTELQTCVSRFSPTPSTLTMDTARQAATATEPRQTAKSELLSPSRR